MNEQRNTFFWSVISVLVFRKRYELIHVSSDQSEAWLKHKQTIVRCKRDNIEFGAVLRNDIFDMYERLYAFKKDNALRNLQCINTYMVATEPVDDYKEVMESALTEKDKKLGEIHHELIVTDEVEHSVQQAKEVYGFSDEDTDHLRHLLSLGEAEVARELATYLEERENKRNSLLNYGKPFVTYFFIALQGLMFLLLELNGGSTNTETLIKYGAKYNPLIVEGEWWRFVTPIVLHIGFIHLAMNTLALYYVGAQVERIFGNARFLCIYLFSGITGVLLSFAMNDSVAAGASGAIFGCFGAFLYIGIKYRDVLSRSVMMNVMMIIGLNIGIGASISGIDNSGHIGGLIGGFLIAMIVQIPNEKKNVGMRVALSILTVALVIGTSVYGFKNEGRQYEAIQLTEQLRTALSNNNQKEAEELSEKLSKYEKKPLDAYYLEAFMNLRKGDYTKAKEQFLHVVSEKENFAPAYYYLSILSLEEKNVKEASEYIEKALKYDKGNKEYEALQKEIKRLPL
ncbi:rhomboid family protein [Priestia taiwanensis]|uniref:Rhomboid protease GluP n=1 Tax=Priestia taiwanensis TaxID=1347902 RepID=A0A917AVN1_9BACI|nr:rhomboid family intramembrane serine protease [Priestia taiwanensis]MBM7363799.1 rhomboid protease GluP [Priestia taiwanensis]GGE74018.1 rhomboid protease GluP [Priestia taiwanensis]